MIKTLKLVPALFLGLLVGLSILPGNTGADVIVPKGLEPGDTIALVTPARSSNQDKIATVEAGLIEQGFKVWKAKNIEESFGYLAGNDELRAAEIMRAWKDPEVDALFSLHGGYGTTRIIDDLDYDYIRNHPKILTGFSDITGLQLAIYRKTGLVSYHAPTTSYVLSRDEEARPFATRSFWSTLMRDNRQNLPVYTDDHISSPMMTIAPGTAKGRLVGGNLSLVNALMGTPFEIQTKDNLLFLEDVGEDPYRIDRMLSTLKLAGKLEEPAGVILGVWAGCDDDSGRGFTLIEVFHQYFGEKEYPVIYRFPTGHIRENATLPVGIMAELSTSPPTLKLLEPPVH